MVRADQARCVYIVENRSCFDRAAMYQVTIEKLFKEILQKQIKKLIKLKYS